ncbi:MAG TPA: pyridoxal-dependent decarboxylase [Bacteroidota bacterium]|nr:pyridoxal-dependent decarboxylase [Bacteroidota bacterium]
MNDVLRSAAERAIKYLEGLERRGVRPDPDAVRRLQELDIPFPETPAQPDAILRMLDEYVSPATMGMAGRRFFGFVIGGALPAPLAATWMAAAWNQNSALYQVTPATAHLERVALQWLVALFGLPSSCGGAFVTGGTLANFTALAAARHAVLERAGWNVEADGLNGSPPMTIVVGDEVHPSLIKSLGLLGLGRARVHRVPADPQGRMLAKAMPRLKGPAIVCAQAGNVNTGSFDPFDEICARGHDAGAWVHVDGAFGLWAAAAPGRKYLTEGMTNADSWATDAHKWLNVPLDSGLAFVRDREALRAAMAITAEYLPTESEFRNPSDYVPELSRRARGVEVWSSLISLGRTGLVELIERTCRHAERFAEGLTAAGFQVLNDVVINQVLVSFGDAVATQKVIAEIQADGTCWCGGTVWQGHTAMRISVSSWATTEEDVEQCLAAMIRCAKRHVR